MMWKEGNKWHFTLILKINRDCAWSASQDAGKNEIFFEDETFLLQCASYEELCYVLAKPREQL